MKTGRPTMTDPIMQKLDEMQALCDAATEGPWRRHSFGLAGEDEPSSIVTHTGEFVWGDVCEGRFLFSTPGADSQEWDDAEFIASARTDMPRLIAALKAVLELTNEAEEERRAAGPAWDMRQDGAAALADCIEQAIEEALGVGDA